MKNLIIIFLAFFAFTVGCKEGKNVKNSGKDVKKGEKKLSKKDKLKAQFKKADKIMEMIAKYSNRKPFKGVKKDVTSKEEVIAYIKEQINKQYQGDEFFVEESLSKLFLIYPWEANYKDEIFKLLKEQVGGYYDPEKKTMYLTDWLPDRTQEIILAHELFHAVQDKNYNILKYLKMDNDNSDAKIAASSVLEGEATAIMLDYETVMKRGMKNMSFDKIPGLEMMIEMQMNMQNSTMKAFAEAPGPIKYSLIFPYIKGLLFVKYIKQKSGWDGLNKLYTRMPSSTEQIIHPEKYVSNEKPIKVSIENSKNIIKDVKLLGKNVMGEATIYTLFKGDKFKETDPNAGSGWGGDKIYVYKKKDRVFAVWSLVWDDDESAKTFFKTVTTYFQKSFKGDIFKDQTIFRYQGPKGLYSGKLDGKKIVILMNIDPKDRETLHKNIKLKLN